MGVLKRTEAEEQAAVIEWANWHTGKYPCLEWLHHIPNGGSRHIAEAVNLKRQGVKAGVSDLFLPYACGEYHGLYIEMKSKTGVLQDSQVKFLDYAEQAGYKIAVCYSADAGITAIKKYLEGEE